ncbi:lactococcin 972 family bacteriocin [Clostridium thermobutyricum]|uniref:lactococcin 972 family bacteriocin n=1 Tax=Clostridium thermobutyricum TaxID=29372 RepID=UPI00374D9F0E
MQYTPEGGTWNYGTTSTDLYSYYYNNDIHDSSTYNPIFGLVQSRVAYSGQTSQANKHVDQFGGNQSYYNDIN